MELVTIHVGLGKANFSAKIDASLVQLDYGMVCESLRMQAISGSKLNRHWGCEVRLGSTAIPSRIELGCKAKQMCLFHFGQLELLPYESDRDIKGEIPPFAEFCSQMPIQPLQELCTTGHVLHRMQA
jgi:hypothetical protein